MLEKVRGFLKRETLLYIAALCAVATMLAVPPDGAYWGYIDLRVLCLLWCLMAVVAGFRACGAFRWLAVRLLGRFRGGTALGITLVLLPFFSAMLVTNDVALLTFVPFTLLVLGEVECTGAAVKLVVLQTLAANLGSMATPVGNPQNLFLYAAYRLSAGDFFSTMLPLTGISLVCLTAASGWVLPRNLSVPAPERQTLQSPKKLMGYVGLFALCLLTVFRILPYGLLTVLVLGAVALLEPKLLRGLDYGLLATFVCFFVASGNLGRIETVHVFLQQLLGKSTLLTAILTSQVISNVPAAVLLSTFTGDWQALLTGVNLGGLGTPVASLASLISMKLYFQTPGARKAAYLGWFTLANLIGLAVLVFFAKIIL